MILFVSIETVLINGASNLTAPYDVLFYSVIAFIVIPLLPGSLTFCQPAIWDQ